MNSKISKVIRFIKAEFQGWTKFEITVISLAFSAILINALILKDNKIAIITAICGILYTLMAGKGKISCYFFGLAGSALYSYLSFKNALYGNLALYALYYIPIEITGIFLWSKHLNSQTQEIEKTKLSKKELMILSILTITMTTATILFLISINDSRPFIDGITTILSIVGMYLTVKRCFEQWIIWIIVNGLSALMWLSIVVTGVKVYSTFIMWTTYFILAIYFFFVWRKKLYTK